MPPGTGWKRRPRGAPRLRSCPPPESRRGGRAAARASPEATWREGTPYQRPRGKSPRARATQAPCSSLSARPWLGPRGSPRSCRRLQPRFGQTACSGRNLGSGSKAPCQGGPSAPLRPRVWCRAPGLSSSDLETPVGGAAGAGESCARRTRVRRARGETRRRPKWSRIRRPAARLWRAGLRCRAPLLRSGRVRRSTRRRGLLRRSHDLERAIVEVDVTARG